MRFLRQHILHNGQRSYFPQKRGEAEFVAFYDAGTVERLHWNEIWAICLKDQSTVNSM